MVVGPLWTARQKDCGQRPRSWGDFFAGQNCFGQICTELTANIDVCSIPGALESNTKVSLVRISTCHFQLCSPGNARTTSINRTFFQRVGSCNNSYLGSGFAAQSSGLPFRKHNVTRFSGGCANMARWFHISLEETLGPWDGLRLLISPERKPFLMTCVRCRRIASCW